MKVDSFNHLLSLIEKAPAGKTRDDLIALAMEKYGWSDQWVEYHLACRAGVTAVKPTLTKKQQAFADYAEVFASAS